MSRAATMQNELALSAVEEHMQAVGGASSAVPRIDYTYTRDNHFEQYLRGLGVCGERGAGCARGEGARPADPVLPADLEDRLECAVCMEHNTVETSLVLRCGHVFHCTCMKMVVRSNLRCPLCRSEDVTPVRTSGSDHITDSLDGLKKRFREVARVWDGRNMPYFGFILRKLTDGRIRPPNPPR